MEVFGPGLRRALNAGLVAVLAAAVWVESRPAAVAQGRAVRLELLDAGSLGGEPTRPPLAGGIWAPELLVLGVEPDLDRTALFRLGESTWSPAGARAGGVPEDAPEMAATRPPLPPAARPAAAAPATGSDELLDTSGPALPDDEPETAPALGRLPPVGESAVWPAPPGLPEVLPFPPLPAGVEDLAIAGSGRDAVALWASRGGTAQAPELRVTARRLGLGGVPAGPDITLQAGPGLARDLAVAVGTDGEAVAAWTNHLAGRGAGLRWRTLRRDGTLGPMRADWEIASDQGSPSVQPFGDGFVMAHLRTPLEGAEPATADASPVRELRVRRLGPDGAPAARPGALVAERRGLDHPHAVARGATVHLWWTDVRAGGRMLRMRVMAADGSLGPEGALRSDLRARLSTLPYRASYAGDGLWLVVWTQLEGRGRAMVLEARLFHASGNAAGPPMVVGRSLGEVVLRDLIESRVADRWIVLWAEEEAGRFHLRYRPIVKR